MKLKKMAMIIEIYEEKVKQLNDLEGRLDKQVLQRVEDFKKYKQRLDEIVGLMVKKQDAHLDEMGQFKTNIRGTVSKVETKIIIFDNRLK